MGQVGQWLGNSWADNDKTAHAFGSTFAIRTDQPHKAKIAKELPSQHTDNPTRQTKQRQKEGLLITAVWRQAG